MAPPCQSKPPPLDKILTAARRWSIRLFLPCRLPLPQTCYCNSLPPVCCLIGCSGLRTTRLQTSSFTGSGNQLFSVRDPVDNSISVQSLLWQVKANCSSGVKKSPNNNNKKKPTDVASTLAWRTVRPTALAHMTCTRADSVAVLPGPSWSKEQGWIIAVPIILPSSYCPAGTSVNRWAYELEETLHWKQEWDHWYPKGIHWTGPPAPPKGWCTGSKWGSFLISELVSVWLHHCRRDCQMEKKKSCSGAT